MFELYKCNHKNRAFVHRPARNRNRGNNISNQGKNDCGDGLNTGNLGHNVRNPSTDRLRPSE